MDISLQEINYNLSILEKTLDSPRAKDLDLGFIEIFANDIQALQTCNFDKKEIKEVSYRLHTIASRIYNISGKSLLGSVDPDAHRSLVGKEKPLCELAGEFSPGYIKSGLDALSPHFMLTPIAGDGHCLFRSIAAATLRWLQHAPHCDQDRFFNHLDEQVRALSQASPSLAQQYRKIQKLIRDLSEKRVMVDEVLSQRSTSDTLVQFLRTLATSYNMQHGNEVFEEECKLEAGSKERYGIDMVDMAKAQLGGEPELMALRKALGCAIVVVDALQIGKKELTVQKTLDELKVSQPVIALLYRPGHYDLLTAPEF